MARTNNRRPDELRSVHFTRAYSRHAEGSVLVEFGDTRVLCTASVEERVPRFLKGSQQGWITAEYGMLPRATGERMAREAARGKQGGRTLEIQRLIGRSLRAALDLKALGERTVTLDCDVIQADAGTRTAAITGAWLALRVGVNRLLNQGLLGTDPIRDQVAAVSVGLVDGEPHLDLDYSEDSRAEVDLNVVMGADDRLLEIQGTAEGAPFSRSQLDQLLDLAAPGLHQLMQAQRSAVQESRSK